jgi:hypothetical protein
MPQQGGPVWTILIEEEHYGANEPEISGTFAVWPLKDYRDNIGHELCEQTEDRRISLVLAQEVQLSPEGIALIHKFYPDGVNEDLAPLISAAVELGRKFERLRLAGSLPEPLFHHK